MAVHACDASPNHIVVPRSLARDRHYHGQVSHSVSSIQMEYGPSGWMDACLPHDHYGVNILLHNGPQTHSLTPNRPLPISSPAYWWPSSCSQESRIHIIASAAGLVAMHACKTRTRTKEGWKTHAALGFLHLGGNRGDSVGEVCLLTCPPPGLIERIYSCSEWAS